MRVAPAGADCLVQVVPPSVVPRITPWLTVVAGGRRGRSCLVRLPHRWWWKYTRCRKGRRSKQGTTYSGSMVRVPTRIHSKSRRGSGWCSARVVRADGGTGGVARDAKEEAGRARLVGAGHDGPRGPVPLLDEGLIGAGPENGPDGRTGRDGGARDPLQPVLYCSARVGAGHDGPRGPVPLLDEVLRRRCGTFVGAYGSARGGGGARDAVEVVDLSRAGVRTRHDGPRCPVPLLDERLIGAAIRVVGADGRAHGVRGARDPGEEVVLGAAQVGTGHDGPRRPVPLFDEGLKRRGAPVRSDGGAGRGGGTRDGIQISDSVVPAFGLGTMDHAVPFHCSIRV